MMSYPVHYRYQDAIDEEGFILIEKKFYPIRETKCYYYVLSEFDYKLHKGGVLNREKLARKVSKNGRVRYCYPDKKLAMRSYIARKKSQFSYAKTNMEKAEYALSKLNENSTFEDLKKTTINSCSIVGYPDFMSSYIFD